MNRSLHDMTDAERGRLFPVILVPHRPEWKAEFEKEKEMLLTLPCAKDILAVYHYGSTAIPGIMAKPCVDILLEVEEKADLQNLIRSIESAGYTYIDYKNDLPPKMMFVKGYTPSGFVGQTFHIHIRYPGIHKEILFMDYLIAHPDIAKEYEALKLALKEKYAFDRDGYTDAKGEFIRGVLLVAEKEKHIPFI